MLGLWSCERREPDGLNGSGVRPPKEEEKRKVAREREKESEVHAGYPSQSPIPRHFTKSLSRFLFCPFRPDSCHSISVTTHTHMQATHIRTSCMYPSERIPVLIRSGDREVMTVLGRRWWSTRTLPRHLGGSRKVSRLFNFSLLDQRPANSWYIPHHYSSLDDQFFALCNNQLVHHAHSVRG